MIEPHKAKALTASKKAIGQLNKVIELIESDSYCMDILQQIRAVEGLLKSVSAHALESHLNTCVGKALTAKNQAAKDKVIKELVKTLKANQK